MPGDRFGRNIALFAVYDGHGGDSVSEFAEHHLHEILLHELQHQHGRDAFDRAITKACQEVDRRLRKRGIGDATGSTVSLALVDVGRGTMVTADLGDSYAFLGVQKDHSALEVVKLSLSQKPGEKSERERIEKAGGHVHDDVDGARIGKLKPPSVSGWQHR
jgi:integrin-linked kinase-associated serine/threonine phosphatase 2C